MVLSQGHLQRPNVQIWIYVIYLTNISEMVHAMTNVGMKHIIYEVIDESFRLRMTFNIWWPLNVK